jgi:predicted nucleotidyltransferase
MILYRDMRDLSGKFVLRVSTELHKAMRKKAYNQGVSLNQFCVQALESSMGKRTEEAILFPDLVKEVRKVWGEALLGILVFGSYVRGQMTQSSDIDILIVLKESYAVTRADYRKWDETIDKKLRYVDGHEISPQFASLPKNVMQAGSLWYQVALEGEVIWKKDSQFLFFLRKVRKAMSEGQIRYSVLHGHPYWVKLSSEG